MGHHITAHKPHFHHKQFPIMGQIHEETHIFLQDGSYFQCAFS